MTLHFKGNKFSTPDSRKSLNKQNILAIIKFFFEYNAITLLTIDTLQDFHNRFKSRGQSVKNMSKWGQSVADFSKAMDAIES